MLINMPLPGQFGLNPVANIIDITTKQLLMSGVPLIETTPGNYSANINIPTKSVPLPLKKDEDIIIPPVPPQPKPSSVIISVTIPGIGIATASNILTSHYVEPIIITQKPIEVDGAIRCPYCFSKIDLPHNPLNFIWSDDPTLCLGNKIMEQYKGCMQIKANHIKELQDNRKNLEESLGIIPLTEFSPIDITYFYQNLCSYILELRESTEKILEAVGMSKDTYFNYNEYGTEMRINHQLDWMDAIDLTSEELIKFQVKSLHIEDLRHYIEMLWKETWNLFSDKSLIMNYSNVRNNTYSESLDEYISGDIWKGGHNIWHLHMDGELGYGSPRPPALDGGNDINLNIQLNGELDKKWSYSAIHHSKHPLGNESGAMGNNNASLYLESGLPGSSIGLNLKSGDRHLYFQIPELIYTFGGSIITGRYDMTKFLIESHQPPPPPNENWVSHYYIRIYLKIYLNDNREIYYYDLYSNNYSSYLSNTSTRRVINLDLNNFDRNIYQDIYDYWGVTIANNSFIKYVRFSLNSSATATWTPIRLPGEHWARFYLGEASASLTATFNDLKCVYKV